VSGAASALHLIEGRLIVDFVTRDGYIVRDLGYRSDCPRFNRPSPKIGKVIAGADAQVSLLLLIRFF